MKYLFNSIKKQHFLLGFLYLSIAINCYHLFLKVKNPQLSYQTKSCNNLSNNSINAIQSKQWYKNIDINTSTEDTGKVANVNEEYSNWRLTYKKNISELEEYMLADMSPYTALEHMSNNRELLEETILYYKKIEASEQKYFIYSVFHQSTDEIRTFITSELLRSNKQSDRQDAISLIMSMKPNVQKDNLIRDILDFETNPEVIAQLLRHLKHSNHRETLNGLFEEINYIAEHSPYESLRKIALESLIHSNNAQLNVFQKSINLIEVENSLTGLEILNQLLNDYDFLLTNQEISSTTYTLSLIADNNNQPLNMRIKAMTILQILEEKYQL